MYVATSDDYVQAFKRSTLYFHFKQGGQLGKVLDKSELFLHKVTQFGDPKQLANVVLKYSPGSTCIVESHIWKVRRSLAPTNER